MSGAMHPGWSILRGGIVAGTMGCAFVDNVGPRVVAVGFGCLASFVVGYVTPRLSSTSIDERILTWIRGRGESHGADIADGLTIGSGLLYPALQRLEQSGALTSEWEGDAPFCAGTPRRRLYRAATPTP